MISFAFPFYFNEVFKERELAHLDLVALAMASEEVDEEIIVEEYEDGDEEDDEMEWVLGEDGNWYCTVEEYDEIEEEIVEVPVPVPVAAPKPIPVPKHVQQEVSQKNVPTRARSGSYALSTGDQYDDPSETLADLRLRRRSMSRVSTSTISLKSAAGMGMGDFKPTVSVEPPARPPVQLYYSSAPCSPATPSPIEAAKTQSQPSSPSVSPGSERRKESKGSLLAMRRSGSETSSALKAALRGADTKGSPLSRLRTAKPSGGSSKSSKGPTKFFGESLDVLQAHEAKHKKRALPNQPPYVPQAIFFIVEHIRSNGLTTPGLFRECGRHADQQEKEAAIEAGVPLEELGLVSGRRRPEMERLQLTLAG